MKTKILFIAFIFVLYFVSLAGRVFAQGSAREERQVANFSGLEVAGPFDVLLSPDGTEKLTLEGDADLLKNVVTEVVGNKLVIRYERDNRWMNGSRNRRTVRVQLSVKQLEHISAAASADVLVKGALQADRLHIDASSGGSVEAQVTTKELTADCSSGADIRLSGTTAQFSAESSSGADITAENLTADKCTLEASSGGDITITVKDELHATASSGGDIRYNGNPPQLKVRSSSGGDVRGRN